MKIEKTWTILSVLVLVLLALAEALTMAVVLQMNILPGKYIVVLVGLMTLSVLGVALFFFVRSGGSVPLARRIISCVLAVLLVCLCVYVSRNVVITYETFQEITNDVLDVIPTGKNMYVLIRAEDPTVSLSTMANYSYGVIANHDVKKVAKFTEWIGKTTGVVPAPTGYTTPPELADALLNKQVDAIIISGVTIALLEEQDAYTQFMSKVKIMAEVPFADLQDKPTVSQDSNGGTNNATNNSAGSNNTEPEQETKPVDPDRNVTNTPFAIYIGASDQYGNTLYASRSDVNILMIVNPTTKQILLINTPRDAYVANPEGDGEMDKLTHCGLYGPSCSKDALAMLYGTQIDYYGQINFAGFKKLIDTIGGITVYSDQAFTTVIGSHYIQKGENHLNGSQALGFARERYRVNGGDNTRGKNQMKVITAVIKKLTSSPVLITKYAEIMSDMKGTFKTNMQMEEISMLVKMQLDDMASWEINSFSVNGTAGSEVTYSWAGMKLYVMHLNQKTVDHASNLINRLVTGEFLKPEDMKVPA